MFLIRFDCGLGHGMGNFVRCRELIKSLQAIGINCTIISEDNTFAREVLPGTGCNIEWKENGEDEAQALLRITRRLKALLLFIDTNYSYSKELVLALKETCAVAFMGNYSSGTFYASYVVHPSEHVPSFLIRRYREALPPSSFRQGFDYVLINRLVKEIEPTTSSFDLVISFGGSDPYDMLKILDKDIRRLGNVKRILVLLGSGYSAKAQYLSDSGTESSVVFKPFTPELLASGRLALTAFGITTYECIYLMKPVLTLGFNRMHSQRGKLFSLRTGCSIHAGMYSDMNYLRLGQLIEELEKHKAEIIGRQRGRIDGKAYERMAADLAAFT